jgi:hypothetical protein
MLKKVFPFVFLAALLLGINLFRVAFPVIASPDSQVYYFTPTPQPDGRILYTVKDGDTCTSISLLNNVTLDQLRLLNDLSGDACLFIRTGQLLLLGVVEKQPTAGPLATATSVLPSPTPFNGTADLCVLLFNDIDGNALVNEGAETALAGGAISVTERNGKVSETQRTNAVEETCFSELPEGNYTISVAIPEGYNPTMRTSIELKVTAGDTTKVDFGAQISGNIMDEPGTPVETTNNKSPILGILGVLVVLAGIVFGAYALRLQKK